VYWTWRQILEVGSENAMRRWRGGGERGVVRRGALVRGGLWAVDWAEEVGDFGGLCIVLVVRFAGRLEIRD
jgi:hypothetical protein